MKTKIFLITIVLVFSTMTVSAQETERKTSFTLSAQPNISWMHLEKTTAGKEPVRLGFTGGLRIDYHVEKFYALSVGLDFNQTGGNVIYDQSFILNRQKGLDTLQPGTKITYRLQYVEIPLALKFTLPQIGYISGFTEIGIDPMLNTKAHIDATDNNVEKEPFKNGINRVNLGWHTGLGVNYALGGNMSLQFALVYKNTFLDVTKEGDIRDPDNVRINQIGLNLGLVF